MKLYYCIVENNIDPDKAGKIQLRVIGKHTENRDDDTQNNYLPVEDLPWANLLSPTTSSNISGQCDIAVPAIGSVGICSYMDVDEQFPILIGTIPKILVELPDFNQGFSDPSGTNPISDLVGESQISRLARNENIDQTIIQDKTDNVEENVDCNGTEFSEPVTDYATVYPQNRVIETASGHFFELDDTTDAERIHLFHKSGTFDEYHTNGDKVENIKAKKYAIITSDDNLYVKGIKNVRIEGGENVEIVGNQLERVEGNVIKDITGTNTENTAGNLAVNVTGGTFTLTASGKVDINSTGAKITIYNGSDNLYDVITDLITKTKAIMTFGGPTNQAVDGASQTALAGVQTRLDSLLE